MRDFWIDLWRVLRGIHRSRQDRVANIAIVLTLGVGIGLVSASYSIFNHLLFRPVAGVGDPSRLITVRFAPADKPNTSGYAPVNVIPALRQAPGLSLLGGGFVRPLSFVSAAGADPVFVDVEFVTSQYLEALQVRSRIGRLPSTPDTGVGLDHGVVISRRLWRQAFAEDPNIVGRGVTLNRAPLVVIGVIDDYQGWGVTRVGTVDLWLPTALEREVTKAPVTGTLTTLVGRLRDTVEPSTVEAQLRQIHSGFSSGLNSRERQFVPTVYPGLNAFESDAIRAKGTALFPFVLAGTGLLLILACGNVTGLLLARVNRRKQELAVCHALGASRWQLARVVLAENAVLAGLGVMVGVALASLILILLRGSRLFAWAPELGEITIDTRVLFFTSALGAFVVLAISFMPAVVAVTLNVRRVMTDASDPTVPRRVLRAAAIGFQIALALTMMIGAGVLTRSLANLRALDLGLEPDGVVLLRVDPMRVGYSQAERHQLVNRIIAGLDNVGGTQVGFVSPPVMGGSRLVTPVRAPDSSNGVILNADAISVSGSYFEILNIPLLAGRTFTDAEFLDGKNTGVAIVNRTFAQSLFGSEAPIGQRIAITSGRTERSLTVVGVVADTRSGPDLTVPSNPIVYEPTPGQLNFGNIVFRSKRPFAEVSIAARQIVRDIDPALPVTEIDRLSNRVERLATEERTFAHLLSLIAVISVALAIAGVLAVAWQTVSERQREVGIRVALGATRVEIAFELLRWLAVVCAFGLGMGLAATAALSRVATFRLHGVSPLDPVSLIGAVTVVAIATVLAALPPTVWATKADPVDVLRR